VSPSQLESIAFTLVRSADASGMIEALEDREPARHPGG
jgi:hypothetical protein